MNLVPNVGNTSVAVFVMTLPDSQDLVVTALNFGRDPTTIDVDLTQVPPGIAAANLAGSAATDIVADHSVGGVSEAGHLSIELEALAGRTIVVTRATQ